MKKLSKKATVISIIVAFTLIALAIAAITSFIGRKSNVVINDTGYVNENPMLIYKANKDLPKEAFLSKKEILEQVNNNQDKTKRYTIQSAELVTYNQYVKKYFSEPHGVNYQIDDNFMVWVVVIKYPDGRDTKAGFYDNATVIIVYDAKTGNALEGTTRGDFKSNGK